MRPSDAYMSLSLSWAIIGSDNGLLPHQRQPIIWTNAELLIIGPCETNFSEILIEIPTFSFKKMSLKMSSGKWRPFCLCLNVLSSFLLSLLPAPLSIIPQATRCMGSHAGFKSDVEIVQEAKSALSHLPVPEGTWQENYSKRNSKWNMYLVGTAALLGVTWYGVSTVIYSRAFRKINYLKNAICNEWLCLPSNILQHRSGQLDLGQQLNIGSGNGLLPDSTKPLPEPVLTYDQRCYVSSIGVVVGAQARLAG